MDDVKIFKTVPDTKNIITKLIEALNSDDTFQKYVKNLYDSTENKQHKKAVLINETIHNIKVFNSKIKPLFLAKDIGILMGISQINYTIRNFEPEEKMHGYINQNNKIKKVVFLTRHGIYRCFFISKSPLAKLFRKFICKLVDHMVEYETNLLNKIAAKFQVENPDLIEQGMDDLYEKLSEYEKKLLEEKKKAEILEEQYKTEQDKRIIAEEENTELDIINTYNTMHITQLKKDEKSYIKKIKTIKNNMEMEESQSMESIELRLLKEKYMKSMYIYILHPTYFKSLLKKKQKENGKNIPKNNTQNKKEDDDSDDDLEDGKNTKEDKHTNIIRENDTELLTYLINDTIYATNFSNIFSKNIDMEKDEILYFCMNFGKNIEKKEKIIHVDTQCIANKKHFINIINSLTKISDVLQLNKFNLYKTSLEEIMYVCKEEFIKLDD